MAEEQRTDKKGAIATKSYIFYIPDLDPLKITYKPSGSAMLVTLATKSSQKFIAVSGPGGLEEYTSSAIIYLDAVDKARSFIDAIKAHSNECESSELKWSNLPEAFDWLNKNIGESKNSGTAVKQSFSKGQKNYLAQFKNETTDSKGITKIQNYTFDLSDINPKGILLEISGKTIKVVVPVKENDYLIQLSTENSGISYAKELEIFVDEIDAARNIINALIYLTTNAEPERKEWNSFPMASDFVKANLKEIPVGSAKIAQEITFESASSGKVAFRTVETDSKGLQSEEENIFYLNDLEPGVKLNVSSKNAYIGIETKDKAKYIKQISKGKTTGYAASLKIYVDNIDQARNIMTALEYVIKNSSTGIAEFSSIQKAIDWLNKTPGDVTVDSKSYHQTIQFDAALENKMDINIITSESSGEGINERFEVYPEDLSVENLKVKVSGKKLYVPISTGKSNYIKAYKGDVQQNYTDEIEFLFEDINIARHFISAMKCVHDQSVIPDRSYKSKDAAYAYLTQAISSVEIAGKKVEQKVEQVESNSCKLTFIKTETDSKGVVVENKYEFILTDIDKAKSLITVTSKDLKINLVTKDKQKLIKPYKNGEPGSFISAIDIYTDDILTAKKILAAFGALIENCK